jgi:hypothetical protein
MDLTIEPVVSKGNDQWAVYSYSEYEDWSVLAGQSRRVFLDSFSSVEEAIAKYPLAQVLDHSTKVRHTMPDTPPDWFDPLDAGEEW